jgi:dihydrofolate reductase
MRILLVAVGRRGEIGYKGDLPWPRLPSDLKRFKRLTTGHAVIMGRKTHESILRTLGEPLPNRKNIVLSTKGEFTLRHTNVLMASSIRLALTLANRTRSERAFFIGGVSIYKGALECGLVDRLMITRVQGEFESDTFFPEVDWSHWTLAGKTKPPEKEKNPFGMVFEVWERRNIS